MRNILRKLLSFKVPIRIDKKYFIIPIIKGIGIDNLRLKNDWFISLLDRITLPENSYFMDVGVNVGQTILKFRGKFDNPYLGFELNLNCIRYVRKLIKINKINHISLFPVGLSNVDNIVVMLSGKDIDNCSSDSTIIDNLRPHRYQEHDRSFAPVLKFDNLKIIQPDECLSMIKIDVEGSELEVIEGLIETLKTHHPLIICEVLDYNSTLTADFLQERANKLYEILRSLDYEVYSIDHTDSKLKFRRITEFKLTQWTPASLHTNDYLFLPPKDKYFNLLEDF